MSGPQRFGLTWWGQRWIEALESLGALYANRLPRGRTYARKGAVEQLKVQPGTVTAAVQGTRARPYKVRLTLPVFSDAEWDAIVGSLSDRLRHAAELLDGRMPEDIDDVLDEHGLSLFPTARELGTRCSCPDVANPCKHVAAVHYVLAQTFDADPFLLPTLRGRDRTTLLAALRAARAGSDELGDVEVEDDGPLPRSALVARELFTAAGDLSAVTVRPHPPEDPGAVLRRLGPPPGLEAAEPLLQQLVEDAARRAWDLLDGDADPVANALLRLGQASVAELAELTALSPDEVRAELRRLREDGRVEVRGRGRGTRYLLQR